MGKYLFKRLIFSLLSMVAILFIVMTLIYVCKDRMVVFNNDDTYLKQKGNKKETYMYQKWKEYGYLDYKTYDEYMDYALERDNVTDPKTCEAYRTVPVSTTDVATWPEVEDANHKKYLCEYNANMSKNGYTVKYLKETTTGAEDQVYFAHKDYNIFARTFKYLGGLFSFENVNDTSKSISMNRSIKWGWDDYSNAPALFGSGTEHKYLIYFNHSPFMSQNWFHINLGTSNANSTKGKSIESILNNPQGSQVYKTTPYPAQLSAIGEAMDTKGDINFTIKVMKEEKYTTEEGKEATREVLVEEIPVNTYKKAVTVKNIEYIYRIYNSNGYEVESYCPKAKGIAAKGEYNFYFNTEKCLTVVHPKVMDVYTLTVNTSSEFDQSEYAGAFDDRYTNYETLKDGKSRIGYSFLCGIVATVCAYVIGLPVGILMARRKDKLGDKIGNVFIVFMIAVPALAYIYFFRAIGTNLLHLPGSFTSNVQAKWLLYVLPVISLALPTIANLMKWVRRYMIDQSNADYVKFARSQGLSEGEIFRKHIARNAAIPIIHAIPASVLACLVGAFYTEQVYSIPGSGRLLTEAINTSDNGTIVALGFFYAFLSIVSLIIGDILITMVDPRISFSEGRRK